MGVTLVSRAWGEMLRRGAARLAAPWILACCGLTGMDAAYAAGPGDGNGGSCAGKDGCPPDAPPGTEVLWIDGSYAYVTSRTDALAQWLDSFFGTPTADIESADSVLRLRSEYQWDEEDDAEVRVRLRGKVDLPQFDRRLSLVFAGGDEDPREEIIPTTPGKDDEDVGLQYRITERARSRLWLTVGTNTSLDFKSSLRYKYVLPLGRDWLLQFTDRLYYKEDDGFGTLPRVDLDYSISDNRLVRWTNELEYGEETDGVEWATRLNYQLRLSSKDALSYFGAVVGDTDRDYLTESYVLGLRYRRKLFRPWIFVEIEPAHAWRRESEEESRSSVWLLSLRLEFVEERSNRRARRGGDGAEKSAVE